MTIMIAVGNGRCVRCHGRITVGSPYVREETADGEALYFHLACPTNGQAHRQAPRAPAASSPGVPQRCICGGAVKPTSKEFGRCGQCGRVYDAAGREFAGPCL